MVVMMVVVEVMVRIRIVDYFRIGVDAVLAAVSAKVWMAGRMVLRIVVFDDVVGRRSVVVVQVVMVVRIVVAVRVVVIVRIEMHVRIE